MASAAAGSASVSTVVINYNGEDYLGPCLDAILGQTLRSDEVIVVDNASEDRSLEVLRERFPEVRVIERAENEGPCPARNEGLRAARNDLVLLVDNDAILGPDVLEKLAAASAADPTAALLQPRTVLRSEPDRVHYDGGRIHYVGLFSLRNFYQPLSDAEGSGVLSVDGAVSVVLLVRRDVILGCGGFDESFFILFEDLDLSIRLRLLGHTILSVEDAIVLHDAGTPGISFREGHYPRSRVFLHSRNRWLMLIKNYRLRTLLVAAPGLLFYELFYGLFALSSGGLWAYLEGKVAFLRCLPATLRRRRVVQGNRTVRDRSLLVAGPLTPAPHVAGSRASRALLVRTLDACLAGWWKLAGRLSG